MKLFIILIFLFLLRFIYTKDIYIDSTQSQNGNGTLLNSFTDIGSAFTAANDSNINNIFIKENTSLNITIEEQLVNNIILKPFPLQNNKPRIRLNNSGEFFIKENVSVSFEFIELIQDNTHSSLLVFNMSKNSKINFKNVEINSFVVNSNLKYFFRLENNSNLIFNETTLININNDFLTYFIYGSEQNSVILENSYFKNIQFSNGIFYSCKNKGKIINLNYLGYFQIKNSQFLNISFCSNECSSNDAIFISELPIIIKNSIFSDIYLGNLTFITLKNYHNNSQNNQITIDNSSFINISQSVLSINPLLFYIENLNYQFIIKNSIFQENKAIHPIIRIKNTESSFNFSNSQIKLNFASSFLEIDQLHSVFLSQIECFGHNNNVIYYIN